MKRSLLFLLFFFTLLSSCSIVDRYYIRNYTNADVVVHVNGQLSPQAKARIGIHRGNILQPAHLQETVYNEVPRIRDSSGIAIFVLPALSVAYVGDRSRSDHSLGNAKFSTADGKEFLWIRYDVNVSPYIYYYDYK